VVQKIQYSDMSITYQTYDPDAKEVLRLSAKPVSVLIGGKALKETKNKAVEGWVWEPLATGGVLRIHRKNGAAVSINLKSKSKPA
jgi:hypothetical protein